MRSETGTAKSHPKLIAAVAIAGLASVAGTAQAFPLFYIQEDCTGCSLVARDGVDSVASITPFTQIRGHSTAVETVVAGAATWLLEAGADAGILNQGGASGPDQAVAAAIVEVPLAPTALFPMGAPVAVSLNYVVTGSVQTPVFSPPLLTGSSEVHLAAESFLVPNADPQSFLPDLRQFGFAADFNADGNFAAFGDGTASGEGAFTGLPGTGDVDVNVVSESVNAHVGDTLTVGLGIFSAASLSVTSPTNGVFEASAHVTLTLPTDRPVFNLPAGYTVSTADRRIVDNQFVPEPDSPAMGGVGLSALALARRSRRRR